MHIHTFVIQNRKTNRKKCVPPQNSQASHGERVSSRQTVFLTKIKHGGIQMVDKHIRIVRWCINCRLVHHLYFFSPQKTITTKLVREFMSNYFLDCVCHFSHFFINNKIFFTKTYNKRIWIVRWRVNCHFTRDLSRKRPTLSWFFSLVRWCTRVSLFQEQKPKQRLYRSLVSCNLILGCACRFGHF